MKIVSAFHITRNPFTMTEKPELEGKRSNSFDGIAKYLVEGDTVTVEVAGKGYKQVAIENGQVMVQRNYSPEY